MKNNYHIHISSFLWGILTVLKLALDKIEALYISSNVFSSILDETLQF